MHLNKKVKKRQINPGPKSLNSMGATTQKSMSNIKQLQTVVSETHSNQAGLMDLIQIFLFLVPESSSERAFTAGDGEMPPANSRHSKHGCRLQCWNIEAQIVLFQTAWMQPDPREKLKGVFIERECISGGQRVPQSWVSSLGSVSDSCLSFRLLLWRGSSSGTYPRLTLFMTSLAVRLRRCWAMRWPWSRLESRLDPCHLTLFLLRRRAHCMLFFLSRGHRSQELGELLPLPPAIEKMWKEKKLASLIWNQWRSHTSQLTSIFPVESLAKKPSVGHLMEVGLTDGSGSIMLRRVTISCVSHVSKQFRNG
ncbi:hypothetical protein F7725_015907 [Dissostichus mawsoni]|uniref:Uncharacterized protein n=1 Tax=Dissostichus mawsoni TaxID=36200 RepID=A0A7J5YJ86_DISMA|nr:hypothetical protein F7725_015907 [Dissostichus mawsoni]